MNMVTILGAVIIAKATALRARHRRFTAGGGALRVRGLPMPVELRRVDPARNMRRLYRLDMQPDLFGGVCCLSRNGDALARKGARLPSITTLRPSRPIARLARPQMKLKLRLR
jgi:hypothetical protein